MCVCVQGGGPADAKLSIVFTDTTHFNGFCSAPRIEKSSHFKRVAQYGSPLFALRASAKLLTYSEYIFLIALDGLQNLKQSSPMETTAELFCYYKTLCEYCLLFA